MESIVKRMEDECGREKDRKTKKKYTYLQKIYRYMVNSAIEGEWKKPKQWTNVNIIGMVRLVFFSSCFFPYQIPKEKKY